MTFLRRHGHRTSAGASPTYSSWQSMIGRCTYPYVNGYERYGGAGINVCERWRGLDGFAHFLADMGERPEGHSIDRIDSAGDYTPENCRWATASEQALNRRPKERLPDAEVRRRGAERARSNRRRVDPLVGSRKPGPPARTHCKKGHLMEGDNVYVNATSGQRYCRACRAEYAKARAMQSDGDLNESSDLRVD